MAPSCEPLADITEIIPSGTDGTTINWTEPPSTDVCGRAISQNRTHGPGESFGLGTTVVTYTRADVYGDTVTCSFDVTVQGESTLVNGYLTDVNGFLTVVNHRC